MPRTEQELIHDLSAILTKAKFENVEPYQYKDLIIPIAIELENITNIKFHLEVEETEQRSDAERRRTFVVGVGKLIENYNL